MKLTAKYFLSQRALQNKDQQRQCRFQMFCRKITIFKGIQRIGVIAGLISGLLLTGCGQKGDLYLPSDSDNVFNQNVSNQSVSNENINQNINDSANMADNMNDNGYDERLDDSPLELDNPLSY